jgi:hypothetical protein
MLLLTIKTISEPLFDRFERYFLSEQTDEESKQSQYRDLDKREGIENEELAL